MPPEFFFKFLLEVVEIFDLKNYVGLIEKKQPEKKKILCYCSLTVFWGRGYPPFSFCAFFVQTWGVGGWVMVLVLLLLFTSQGLRVSVPRLGMCA
jgi:hypothetical protein